MAFIYYNANPKGNNVFDCTVRALSVTTGKSYKQIFRELSENALDMGLMLEDVKSIEDYLDERYRRTCHYSKTLGELADELPYGKYVVTMNNHLSAIINGNIVDTFDPSNRIIRCSWRIK